MANRFQCRNLHVVASQVRWITTLASLVLLLTGCRTPWNLSGRPVEDGIGINELTSNSTKGIDEIPRSPAKRGQPSTKNSRYGSTKDDVLADDAETLAFGSGLDDEPAWMTEGLQAAPAQQRDLLRKQLQASRQAKETRDQSDQSVASKIVADESDRPAKPHRDSTEPSSAFRFSDRDDVAEDSIVNNDRLSEGGATVRRLGADASEKTRGANKLTTESASRKNPSSIAEVQKRELPETIDAESESRGGTGFAASSSRQTVRNEIVTTAAVSPANESPESVSSNNDSSTALDWRGHLREAQKAMESESESSALSPEQQLHQETVKRMISLSVGDLESAMKPIDGVQPHVQDYFRYQFQAIHDAIDPSGNPVPSRRWTLALQNSRKSLAHLSAVSNLEVQNLTFCSLVDSFGVTTKYPQYHFRPEQELLLYCEVDNFVAEPVKDGFETQLQGSFEIVDSNGRRAADQLLQLDQHVCRNQRRDYFIAYRIFMPREIAPGRYQLKLTIEDMKGRKFGQSTIDFQIVQ